MASFWGFVLVQPSSTAPLSVPPVHTTTLRNWQLLGRLVFYSPPVFELEKMVRTEVVVRTWSLDKGEPGKSSALWARKAEFLQLCGLLFHLKTLECKKIDKNLTDEA